MWRIMYKWGGVRNPGEGQLCGGCAGNRRAAVTPDLCEESFGKSRVWNLELVSSRVTAVHAQGLGLWGSGGIRSPGL